MNSSFGSIGGIAGTSIGETKPRQNPLDSVGNTLEQARALVSRMEELADRLCGQRPPEATTGKSGLSSGGLLDSVRDHAESVAERLQDGHRAIGRIENLL